MLIHEFVDKQNRNVGDHNKSSFYPSTSLAVSNVHVMGSEKSRFTTTQSSWSAQTYAAYAMRGSLKRSEIPSHLKLPTPRPTYPNRSPHRKTPSTLGLPNSYLLPRMTGVKQEPRDIVSPRLNSIHKNVYGVRLGLFAWPEQLPQRILDKLAKKLKVQGGEPLPHDFKNSRGMLRCPLCLETKEFIQCSRFTRHLRDKH
jgi:hypothetical protein